MTENPIRFLGRLFMRGARHLSGAERILEYLNSIRSDGEQIKSDTLSMQKSINGLNKEIEKNFLESRKEFERGLASVGSEVKSVQKTQGLSAKLISNNDKRLKSIEYDVSKIYNIVERLEIKNNKSLRFFEKKLAPLSSSSLHQQEEPRRIAIAASSFFGNNAGRVQVLADISSKFGDVEVLSPLFAAQSASVWAPLAGSYNTPRTFDSGDMNDFIPSALRFVETVECDAVIISKVRLPGMLLGMLIRYRSGCPVVLDNDDWELSFFSPRPEALSIPDISREPPGPRDDIPYAQLWSRVAESLVPSFTDRTAASISLRQRFGGNLIRHSRNEQRFVPDLATRQRMRSHFGIHPQDVVILFLGTPRPHKGLLRVAEAIERVSEPRFRFVVIGDCPDAAFAQTLSAHPCVSMHPNQPWDELPNVVQIADGVCLLQDLASDTSSYQIPAKLTDALAMGISVGASPSEALADIPEDIVARLGDDAALDAWLRALVYAPVDPTASERRRGWFLQELSDAVNATRLELVLRHAEARPAIWPAEWTALFKYLNERYGTALPEDPPAWSS